MRNTFGLLVLCLLAAAARPAGAQESVTKEETAAVVGTPIHTPAELAQRLDRILDDPALTRAHVGLLVQVAETGEVLYARNAEKRFLPASNAKLVTTAVALDVLGPDYRWVTRLEATGPIREGVLAGDLWIVGGGDPWLVRRELAEWPHRLRKAGVRRIAGDVIGDDRVFVDAQWGTGWMWDDLWGGWSAGISGLQLSPNTVRGHLVPGDAVGDPAAFTLAEPGPSPPIAFDVRTGPPGSETRLRFLPAPEGGPVQLRGWIPAGRDSVSLYLATPHPTLYLLDALAAAMEAGGVSVEGRYRRARPDEMPADPVPLVARESEPLCDVLPEVLKPSDNQMAETLLRTVGREAGREGSAAAGLEVLEETLAGWGIEPGAVSLVDGSGLSRYDQVTPAALARLLRTMWRHAEWPVFRAALPVAAVDGTLKRRLLGTPAARDVRAKTGSLSGVRALSGYLTSGSGETLVFALLLNGYDAPGDVAVALEDLLIEQISLYRRAVVPGWPGIRPGGNPE